MIYLVFDTEQDAQTSADSVAALMGCPITNYDLDGNLAPEGVQKTERWAIPQQRIDGKWCYPKPAAEFVVATPAYVEEEFDISWFPAP